MNTYVANGSVTSFPYTFQIGATADLKVYVAGILQATGFSITGAGNLAGGSVVFNTAPANGAEIELLRQTILSREIDYTEGAAFSSSTFDADIDRVVRQVQDVDFALQQLTARVTALEGGA